MKRSARQPLANPTVRHLPRAPSSSRLSLAARDKAGSLSGYDTRAEAAIYVRIILLFVIENSSQHLVACNVVNSRSRASWFTNSRGNARILEIDWSTIDDRDDCRSTAGVRGERNVQRRGTSINSNVRTQLGVPLRLLKSLFGCIFRHAPLALCVVVKRISSVTIKRIFRLFSAISARALLFEKKKKNRSD